MRSSFREWGRACQAAATRHAMLPLLLGMTLSSACAANSNSDEAAEPVPATHLQVQNRAYLDMTIYAYRSSQRTRLGIATGNATTTFTIPQTLIFGATPLRFQADPIGGTRSPVSQEIQVSPGDVVVLTIPP